MEKFLALLLTILIFGSISWIITCGIIKAISLCFGFDFTWKLATGIWLLLGLISGVLTGNKN